MSSSLYYRPHVPREGVSLSCELKRALSPRVWEHDGSLGGSIELLMAHDLEFLRGLVAGGLKDAQKLIDAIRKHGAVEVWLEV